MANVWSFEYRFEYKATDGDVVPAPAVLPTEQPLSLAELVNWGNRMCGSDAILQRIIKTVVVKDAEVFEREGDSEIFKSNLLPREYKEEQNVG